MKAIIWGAADEKGNFLSMVKKEYEVICYVDNNEYKQGNKLNDLQVISPKEIGQYQWDVVIINSLSAKDSIKKQLIEMNIEEGCLITKYVDVPIEARINFLKGFAWCINELIKDKEAAVAEVGVFQGEFAAEINKSFPDRKLYLFDTFEGFDERDISLEKENNFSDAEGHWLNMTSKELVLEKMVHPEKVIIKKGYFPDTTRDINEHFAFVNIDVDLYKPTLEGLIFFYDKLIRGGGIVVHDFFSDDYMGVNQAVYDFFKINSDLRLKCAPIGDGVSLVIYK